MHYPCFGSYVRHRSEIGLHEGSEVRQSFILADLLSSESIERVSYIISASMFSFSRHTGHRNADGSCCKEEC